MTIKNKNKRIGTTSNLEAGGTYDLLMISYADGFPEGQIRFDIGSTPRKITGIQKVAQTFLKTLMTSKGSDLFYPKRGTNFPSLVINANRPFSDLLQLQIQESLRDAITQTKRVLNLYSSDKSSQLEEVKLLGMRTADDVTVIFMQIITKAGEEANVAVPFPELDLE